MPLPQNLVLPQGLSGEQLENWLGDNPGATVQDGLRAYVNFASRRDAKPVEEVILDLWPGLRAAPPAGAQLGSPGFAGGVTPYEGTPGMTVQQGVSKLGTAGLGLAAGPVAAIGAGLKGSLARLGAMGSLGAAKESLAGGSSAAGFAEGVVGQGLGEVVRGASALPQGWKQHMATTANRLKWAAKDAVDAMRGAVQEVPWFLRAIPQSRGPADMLNRLTQAVPGDLGKRTLGQKILSEAFQDSESQVVRVLGGESADIVAPTLRRAMMSEKELQALTPKNLNAAGQARFFQTVLNEPITVKQALHTVKSMIAEAIDAGRSYESHVLWDAVDKGRGELMALVKNRAPDVAVNYEQAWGLYARGTAILNSLSKSEAFGGKLVSPTRTTFDADAFLDYLQEKGLQGYVPKVTESLTRGGEWQAREMIRSLPRGRIYRLGESATFALPGVRVAPRGGVTEKIIPPATGAWPTRLGLWGIEELTRAPGDRPSSYTIE